MNKINKRDFNFGAKLFLGVSIFFLAKDIFAYLAVYDVVHMLGFVDRQSQLVTMISLNVLMIGSACTIYAKKRWGLLSFLLLAIVKVFVTIPPETNGYAFALGYNIGVFIREMGLFLIAMCFRKNGISGWVAFFASDEYIDKHAIVKNEAPVQLYDIKDSTMAITPKGLKLLLVGLIVMIAGYVLMLGGNSGDPNVFSEDIYDFQRLYAAPVVIICGIVIEVVAIMKVFKSK